MKVKERNRVADSDFSSDEKSDCDLVRREREAFDQLQPIKMKGIHSRGKEQKESRWLAEQDKACTLEKGKPQMVDLAPICNSVQTGIGLDDQAWKTMQLGN